jgi:benzoyl-CoA 2,3-dioxygenase component A
MVRQHLIDPEICIRCNTCEKRCPSKAIRHETNYVVDFDLCKFCMACVRPCPTGAIDNWFNVERPYSVGEQLAWAELPARSAGGALQEVPDALDPEAAAILATAHRGVGGQARAPASASKPSVNLFTRANPARATLTGNVQITADGSDSEVHHLILDFGTTPFPYLEGQSVGVVPPGLGPDGKPHGMRLYSIASARDGERPNTNNMALTVKRIIGDSSGGKAIGVASNWLCDLALDEPVDVVGPFGATFLMPEDPEVDLLMICTGTGVSPFRGFTHRRRRTFPQARGRLFLFYGARSPEELPYFGPLQKYLQSELHRELVYSRRGGSEREYVQDRLYKRSDLIAELLCSDRACIYVCGLRGLEDGVELTLGRIAGEHGIDWESRRSELRRAGRFHVETY